MRQRSIAKRLMDKYVKDSSAQYIFLVDYHAERRHTLA